MFHIHRHPRLIGVAPRPGCGLRPVAQHTTLLRFGPLVHLLPLHHVLKLLEQICMLDRMRGGRMLLGVEALEVMLRGMTSKKLSFAGKYDRYADVPPHPPLRHGLEVVAVRLDIAPKQ